ncbi:MAG: hypothetical protein LC798_05340 [Chloroflexi bacterium]|nr:hypothetical protein [Chloroflexota bacterium]
MSFRRGATTTTGVLTAIVAFPGVPTGGFTPAPIDDLDDEPESWEDGPMLDESGFTRCVGCGAALDPEEEDCDECGWRQLR